MLIKQKTNKLLTALDEIGYLLKLYKKIHLYLIHKVMNMQCVFSHLITLFKFLFL